MAKTPSGPAKAFSPPPLPPGSPGTPREPAPGEFIFEDFVPPGGSAPIDGGPARGEDAPVVIPEVAQPPVETTDEVDYSLVHPSTLAEMQAGKDALRAHQERQTMEFAAGRAHIARAHRAAAQHDNPASLAKPTSEAPEPPARSDVRFTGGAAGIPKE